MREYNDFLKSDTWKSLRIERLSIDGNKCVICGCSDRLEVHHLYYPKKWEDTTTDHLVTLCKGCHVCVHRIQEKYHEYKADYERRNSEPFLRESGYMQYEASENLYNKIKWILAEELFRKNIFRQDQAQEFCKATTRIALHDAKLCENTYGACGCSSNVGGVTRLLAFAKDCYMSNPNPVFNKDRRKAHKKQRQI